MNFDRLVQVRDEKTCINVLYVKEFNQKFQTKENIFQKQRKRGKRRRDVDKMKSIK
jgi:hypothetical protein